MQNENVLQKTVVLHFASWYPTNAKPMLGVFIKKHILLLNKEIQQAVVYFNITNDTTVNLKVFNTKKEDLNEIEILINKQSVFKLFYIIFGFFKAKSMAKKIIGRADIIHLHTILPMAPLVWFYSFLNHAKIVITEHWTGYQPEDGNYTGFFKTFFTKKIIAKSSCVITVSKQLANAMQQHQLKFNNKIISNYVDVSVFNNENKKVDSNNIIHISSLDDRQKNVSGLLNAFAKVINDVPQATLTIIGSGGDEDYLKKLCIELNINNHVLFLGKKTGNELAQQIKNSAALVMFSRFENQPVVILEALACGTPVISTYVGGINEMLDNSNSLRVESENNDQLSKAILKIINKECIFNETEISQNILKTIHPDIIKEKHLEIYRECLVR